MIHRFAVRVYYEDTDLAGVVYYANYLKFLERGRSEALRALGIDQSRMKDQGTVFVVTRVEIDYRAPARFEDVLEVTTALHQRHAARAILLQTVEREGKPLVEAKVTIACIDTGGRPVRFGNDVADALDRMRPDG
ncbi:MAG: tol-pal system-associated acyl-CoA thioesterase [Pseudomonadota bacterium]